MDYVINITPEINADIPLEEIVKLTKDLCRPCRNTSCCETPPVLLEGEMEKIAEYLDMESSLLKNAFVKKEVYYKERFLPKIHNFYCFFAVGKWLKTEERMKKEIVDRISGTGGKLAIINRVLNNFLERTAPLRTYCGIYSVRPAECRVIHCTAPELSSYFTEKFLVDRNDPRTTELFEAEKKQNFCKKSLLYR